MRVDVKLFGFEARQAGCHEVTLTFDGEIARCDAVRDALAKAKPVLARVLSNCRFAVNHEFVSDAFEVRAGDEVALIGMVSGG